MRGLLVTLLVPMAACAAPLLPPPPPSPKPAPVGHITILLNVPDPYGVCVELPEDIVCLDMTVGDLRRWSTMPMRQAE
jgi:hypothetical protein